MKRIYMSIPNLPERHIIYKGMHIINTSAEESNVYVIIRYLPKCDWITTTV